jgi:dihydropyrimidinase
MKRILIQNALLIDSLFQKRGDLLIEGEKIKRIAAKIELTTLPNETTVVDASNLIVMPAVIDAHTHYHLVSRNSVTADSFYDGSKLAAFGGVTTVIDFADHDKSLSLLENGKVRISEMEKEMAIDFALHQGVYKVTDTIETELKELVDYGISAIKIFTTYKDVGYLIEIDLLKKLFEAAKKEKALITAHCEDDLVIQESLKNYKGDFNIKDHPLLRPSIAEAKAILQLGKLAKESDSPLYVVHLSSEAGLEAVRELRKEGVKVVVETTPHYLFLNNFYLEKEEGSLYLMTPPLREPSDNKALQEALNNDEIDIVATDHCSFSKEQKQLSSDCRYVLPGIPGSEELFSLIFTHFDKDYKKVVELLSSNVAKAFGLYPEKGSLEVGTDADLILVDPKASYTISSSTVHSKANYSPYDTFKVKGKIVQTYLRGKLIVDNSTFLGEKGEGKFVKAKVSSAFR